MSEVQVYDGDGVRMVEFPITVDLTSIDDTGYHLYDFMTFEDAVTSAMKHEFLNRYEGNLVAIDKGGRKWTLKFDNAGRPTPWQEIT